MIRAITVTILAGVLWFAFIVLYLAFYAINMNLWQKAAIFLATGAIVGGIIAVLWVIYGLKSGKSQSARKTINRRTT